MAAGDTARLYHRLTSYTFVPEDQWPTRWLPPVIDDPLVLQDFVPVDFERLPPAFKAYPPGLPSVDLPRDWPAVPGMTTAVLAGQTATAPGRVDIPALARLLHLSAGIVRVDEHWHGRRLLFRAAGSAGGRFPLEVYVSARGVEGLPDGVHWYDAVAHALVQVGPAAGGAATTLIVTGVPWRTGWKYAERGFRHIYWDAGSMLAQTLVLAESASLGPRLWTRFADADITTLVGADGVHEFPVALVALGDGTPAIQPGGGSTHGEVDTAPLEFPLVTLAQHAGDADDLGDPWLVAPPLRRAIPRSPEVEAVILKRGSTRQMDATKTIARDVFEFSVAAALRAATVPHFIAVHGVNGVDQGLYRWPDLDRAVRRESLREEMLLVCWDQNLGRDAAFVVVAAADLETIDDRSYREAQLEAGIVEGRLHLAAYALGIGACGMTFLDDEIEGLLRESLAGLLITCIGVPTYENKPGGRPGAPVPIFMPTSGETPRKVSPS